MNLWFIEFIYIYVYIYIKNTWKKIKSGAAEMFQQVRSPQSGGSLPPETPTCLWPPQTPALCAHAVI